jgi:hypothetical protein
MGAGVMMNAEPEGSMNAPSQAIISIHVERHHAAWQDPMAIPTSAACRIGGTSRSMSRTTPFERLHRSESLRVAEPCGSVALATWVSRFPGGKGGIGVG